MTDTSIMLSISLNIISLLNCTAQQIIKRPLTPTRYKRFKRKNMKEKIVTDNVLSPTYRSGVALSSKTTTTVTQVSVIDVHPS